MIVLPNGFTSQGVKRNTTWHTHTLIQRLDIRRANLHSRAQHVTRFFSVKEQGGGSRYLGGGGVHWQAGKTQIPNSNYSSGKTAWHYSTLHSGSHQLGPTSGTDQTRPDPRQEVPVATTLINKVNLVSTDPHNTYTCVYLCVCTMCSCVCVSVCSVCTMQMAKLCHRV